MRLIREGSRHATHGRKGMERRETEKRKNGDAERMEWKETKDANPQKQEALVFANMHGKNRERKRIYMVRSRLATRHRWSHHSQEIGPQFWHALERERTHKPTAMATRHLTCVRVAVRCPTDLVVTACAQKYEGCTKLYSTCFRHATTIQKPISQHTHVQANTEKAE